LKQTDAWLETYFNRRDVKEALHAPFEKEWSVCTNKVGTDPDKRSPLPIQGVLPRLIEKTNRVLIASGGLDGIILTNGTLLAIQNMTFNGQLGFQETPTQDFVLPADSHGPQNVVGKQHYERGLLWLETYESGHEQPMYAPRAALRQLQWLRGEIDAL
jgi:carboxypeptidase D